MVWKDLQHTNEGVWNNCSFRDWLFEKLELSESIDSNDDTVISLVDRICWAIWRGRNGFVLRGEPVSPLDALTTAKTMHNNYCNLSHTSPAQEAVKLP